MPLVTTGNSVAMWHVGLPLPGTTDKGVGMKIFACLTREGTAAPEMALCEEHVTDATNRDAAIRVADDDVDVTSFVDCSDNGELECQVCGKPNYGPGISAQRIRVAIGYGEALRRVLEQQLAQVSLEDVTGMRGEALETARRGVSDVVAVLHGLYSALTAG